jgi:5-methylthioribose kinase
MQDAPFPLITLDDHSAIKSALEHIGLWNKGEVLGDVQRAGEGNMNAVLRVVSSHRSVILKQSRPWVEKYPQIEASAERILAEIDFYRRVSPYPYLAASMPRLLAASARLHLMAMEDLGDASDYSSLYNTRDFESLPLREATEWLAHLHRVPLADDAQQVGNQKLRELNHAHMFVIPLQSPSAIPLDDVCDGLENLAVDLKNHKKIHEIANVLGEQYLSTGSCLLHGDFYPGSWLATSDGFRVIDPEFCFAGPPEFDLGVLTGHRVLIGGSVDSVDVVLQNYGESGGPPIDQTLVRGFAAVEIVRRLIGVAQLQLKATLAERASMLQVALRLLGIGN